METCYRSKIAESCPFQKHLLQKAKWVNIVQRFCHLLYKYCSSNHNYTHRFYKKIIEFEKSVIGSTKHDPTCLDSIKIWHVSIVIWMNLIYWIDNLPYEVYLSGSLLTIPRNGLLDLTSGNRILAISGLHVSTNWISLSVVAAQNDPFSYLLVSFFSLIHT